MLHRIPIWFQRVFTGYVWNIKSQEKIIYLTFDDGPIPGITEWVLDVLKEHQIQATFFVVGENVARYPTLLKRIDKESHRIGNHTFHHVKGWSVSADVYVKEVDKCTQIIEDNTSQSTKLFRPPYGRIKSSQAQLLRKKYTLIMWDTLTADYDKRLNEKKCLTNSIRATRDGSIVVFHDSLKAAKNLKYVLPRYIAHFKSLGYTFKAL